MGAAHEPECGVTVEVEIFEVIDSGGATLSGCGARQPSLEEHGDGLDVDKTSPGRLPAQVDGPETVRVADLRRCAIP